MAKDKQEGPVTECKETHTDEKSTIEYQDLKAETKHKDKAAREQVEEYENGADWEISTNGDKIADQKGCVEDIKNNLKRRYKRGQERIGK